MDRNPVLSRPDGGAHYANLTNGLLCAPPGTRFTRIPSTFCEQKMWDRVIHAAGPDLLMRAAAGGRVIVHDQSERQRATRAQWQGLSWLRYSCSMAWGVPEPFEVSRGGVNVTSYWRKIWLGLPGSDKAWLRYFGRHARTLERVDIRPCDCVRQEWVHGDGRSIRAEGKGGLIMPTEEELDEAAKKFEQTLGSGAGEEEDD